MAREMLLMSTRNGGGREKVILLKQKIPLVGANVDVRSYKRVKTFRKKYLNQDNLKQDILKKGSFFKKILRHYKILSNKVNVVIKT